MPTPVRARRWLLAAAAAAAVLAAAAAAAEGEMAALSPAVAQVRPDVTDRPTAAVTAPHRMPRAVEHRSALAAGAAYAQAVEQARLEAAVAYVRAVEQARLAAYVEAVEQARRQAEAEVTPAAVLAALGFDPARYAPGWTITWAGSRPDIRGIADPNSRTITIYLRAGLSAANMAYVLAHELGHAVNYDRFPGGSDEWMAARGLGGAWYSGTYSDTSTPAGDWAEAFAWTVTGGATGEWYSRLGSPPDAAQQALVRALAG